MPCGRLVQGSRVGGTCNDGRGIRARVEDDNDLVGPGEVGWPPPLPLNTDASQVGDVEKRKAAAALAKCASLHPTNAALAGEIARCLAELVMLSSGLLLVFPWGSVAGDKPVAHLPAKDLANE